MHPPKSKVLLIGWDAADWNVARPLIEAGKMPNLKKLMDKGAWGNLATIRPVLSPMLWTSIATGKRAWKHGIHGFSEPCPATGGIRPISGLSRKTKAVWNIFNQQGWQSHVIGWWPSHPAEPINGVMVSNHFQQAVKGREEAWPMRPGTVHPERLVEPLKEMRVHPAELRNEHILPFIPKAAEIDQEKDKRMASCAKIIAENAGIHAAATAVMQLEPWDFMAVYYDGIDHFGHGFMKFHPPRRKGIAEKDFELYQGVIEAGYRFHDMMLGTLLELAGEDTTVMLISDHGFEPGNLRPDSIPNEPAGAAAEHSPFGIFCLRGPGIAQGACIQGASLLDITPTLLHLYGLPVGSDMDGKVLVNAFEEKQTIAYIDSWDAIDGDDGRHPVNTTEATGDSVESLRQLVDLGYIDAPDTDKTKAVDNTVRELQYNLAQAYFDGGRLSEAAQIFAKLWERNPDESRFGTKLLSCWLALEDAIRARSTFDQLLERKKIAASKASEELKSMIREIKEAKGIDPDAEKEAADNQWMADLDQSTSTKLRRLRGQAGMNPHAVAYLAGSILALEDRYPEALEQLAKAAQVQEANRPSLLCRMGEIHFKMENDAEAERCFTEVLGITANSSEARIGLARIFFRRKSFFQSAAEALASLELIFHQPRAHTLYGASLLRLGKVRMGEQALLTAVSQNPGYAPAHEELARAYARRKLLKDPEKAAKHRSLAAEARRRLAEVRAGLDAVEGAERWIEFPRIASIQGRLAPAGSHPLIVVSGLPRSGTSLMMQMLASGGVPIVTDQQREADESNPKGYFEDERVKGLAATQERSWLADHKGEAIKIVAPLLPYIPKTLPTRVIFMERPSREVVHSQQALLSRDGKTGAIGSGEDLSRIFANHLAEVSALMEQHPLMEVLPVSYHELLRNPLATAKRLETFLKKPLDLSAMAAIPDKSLHRSREA